MTTLNFRTESLARLAAHLLRAEKPANDDDARRLLDDRLGAYGIDPSFTDRAIGAARLTH
jgi:hypothetical protein